MTSGAVSSSASWRIRVSVSIDESPSEHNITTSPGAMEMVCVSTSTVGSVPSARVMTER